MLSHSINPKAVNRSDKYLVIKQEDSFSWRVVESQPTFERASHAVHILTQHSIANGGKNRYDMREMGAYTPPL